MSTVISNQRLISKLTNIVVPSASLLTSLILIGMMPTPSWALDFSLKLPGSIEINIRSSQKQTPENDPSEVTDGSTSIEGTSTSDSTESSDPEPLETAEADTVDELEDTSELESDL